MSQPWEMVIGLEVHCQLATKTKLFCGCSTESFGAVANTNVCPVCTGQPGVLPVLNRNAVELAFKAAMALECKLAPESIFARKNYFYPDLPKAYQISQYELPFSRDGGVDILPKDAAPKRVRIHRIHLEEDAGKLLHEIGSQELDCSLVDFNRGGTPLIEIVTEPDIRTSEEAYAYLTALKEIIIYAGASRCDMEKGEMRCDANVSVRRPGAPFGTRAEIKNLNSFRNVKDAIEHEFARQVALIEEGGKVVQETRLWDAAKQATRSMRSKEEAHDYRYFPDPDLVPLKADAPWVAALKASLPELPNARRARFASEYKLSEYDADVLASQKALGDYFETAAKGLSPEGAKTAVNLITTELLGKLNAEGLAIEGSKISAASLGELVALIAGGTLSSKLAKEVFAKMWETGKSPKALVEESGLSQVSDAGQIKKWVEEALAANPKAAEDLRQGKDRAIGSIVGGVMKLSKGKANPALVNQIIKEVVKP
jgi:aspartyl-tRNA(Asn)/glutamyl-tRNA(Gln) amidotransferase subunit B